jgi:hypothetical protein
LKEEQDIGEEKRSQGNKNSESNLKLTVKQKRKRKNQAIEGP